MLISSSCEHPLVFLILLSPVNCASITFELGSLHGPDTHRHPYQRQIRTNLNGQAQNRGGAYFDINNDETRYSDLYISATTFANISIAVLNRKSRTCDHQTLSIAPQPALEVSNKHHKPLLIRSIISAYKSKQIFHHLLSAFKPCVSLGILVSLSNCILDNLKLDPTVVVFGAILSVIFLARQTLSSKPQTT